MKPIESLDRTSLEKLPKWAQDHIRHVEMRLREVSGELKRHLDSRPPSEAAVHRILDDEQPFAFLEPRCTVAFFLDNEHHKEARQRKVLYIRRGFPHRGEHTGPYHLEIRTGGSSYPTVQGQASNTLRMRITDEY